MGKPAEFVRMAGCNLSCSGCDTHHHRWEEQSIPAIMNRLTGRRVVITGGEPTLQMTELEDLINCLHQKEVEIHIESNGTGVLSSDVLEKLHFAVISPKFGSDWNLEFWQKIRNAHLKFVLGPKPWCWPPHALNDLVPALSKDRVWLMPYGTDKEMAGAEMAWDLALKLGVNYSDRLHVRVKRP